MGSLSSVSSKHLIIPKGLIIPYNSDSSIPSGWIEYTNGQGRYIAAAKDEVNFRPTNEGGHNDLWFYTLYNGSHYGSNKTTLPDGGGLSQYSNAAGGHRHFIYPTSLSLKNRTLRFIKSNINNLTKFPTNAIALSDKDLSSKLTQFFNNDNLYLKNGSALSSIASNSWTKALTNNGSHTHLASTANRFNSGTLSNNIASISAGEHTHTLTGFDTLTTTFASAILTAWGKSDQNFGVMRGQIAFWESLTPPSGWVICDGNNGTIDYRKHFIIFGNTSTHGTKQNSGVFNMQISSGTINNTINNHNHRQSLNNNVGSIDNYHGLADVNPSEFSHSHTMETLTFPFPPEYYALSLIQKI